MNEANEHSAATGVPAQERRCSSCNAGNPEHAKFCRMCGKSLADAVGDDRPESSEVHSTGTSEPPHDTSETLSDESYWRGTAESLRDTATSSNVQDDRRPSAAHGGRALAIVASIIVAVGVGIYLLVSLDDLKGRRDEADYALQHASELQLTADSAEADTYATGVLSSARADLMLGNDLYKLGLDKGLFGRNHFVAARDAYGRAADAFARAVKDAGEAKRAERLRLGLANPLTFRDIRFRNHSLGWTSFSDYSTSFQSQALQFLGFSASFTNNLFGLADTTVTVYYRYIQPDGSVLKPEQSPPGYSGSTGVMLDKERDCAEASGSLGWESGGHFSAGTYRVELFLGGERIAWGEFNVW